MTCAISKRDSELLRALSLLLAVAISFLGAAPAATADDDDKPKIEMKLEDLLPDSSRFFRGFVFKTSYLDQQDFDIDSTTGMETPNPDDHLWKFEVSLDLSKVLWSTSELVAVYALAAGDDTRDNVKVGGFGDRIGDNPLQFFARARPNDRFRRFASAWTLSTGQSEREAPDPLGAMEPPADFEDFEETYSVVFDPKKVFLTTDRVLTAYKGVQHFVTVHKQESGVGTRDEQPMRLATSALSRSRGSMKNAFKQGRAIEVLRELSGLGVAKQSLVAAIPAIEYKTVDQFDFASVGGFSLATPFVEGSIETIVATWDLSSALNTAERRRSALEAIALHEKLAAQDETLRKVLEVVPGESVVLCTGRYAYVPFKAKNAVGSITWSSDGHPDGLDLGKTGVLQGTPSEDGRFKVTATESFKEVPRTDWSYVEVAACG